MCGVAGFLTLASGSEARVHIAAMTRALVHRGPDAGDVWLDERAEVALGHRRLAIVELSERGAQPMHSACGRYVLTYNGEIYNHLDLRAELEIERSTNWRGTSDTETLLAGVVAWGVEATLKKAVGMFAFGLWDRAERRLTLARDRFGEKPLYYGWLGQGRSTVFAFGSELKALRAHPSFDNPIDRDVLALFLRFSYVPAPYAIFKNTFKLAPGAILTLDPEALLDRKTDTNRYWRYEQAARDGLADPIRDENEGLEELGRVLLRSVRGQLMSDVPLGAFLSGGVDSSTTVALMQALSGRPVKTFTVAFDDVAFNEAPYAASVARHLGTEHHEVHVSPEETLAVIPDLPRYYDEPFADSSQIPTCIICAAAREHVAVALSGDAGDELFGGYNRYVIGPKLWDVMSLAPPMVRKPLGAGVENMPDWGWTALARFPGLGGNLAKFKDKAYKIGPGFGAMRDVGDLYRALVTEWTPGSSPAIGGVEPQDPLAVTGTRWIEDSAQRMMFIDGLTYLPDDILTKVDRAAMAVSLETRVPFLDHRVAELAWRLPMRLKIRGGVTKWALRQILYERVPKALIERPKSGFAIPVGQWLRGPLREWAEALLDERRLEEQGYLDVVKTRKLWSEHCRGKRNWTSRLWNILMWQAWLETLQRNDLRLANRGL